MRPCYIHEERKATYPAKNPVFCSMTCAAKDAVRLRYDSTPLEVSLFWCDYCQKWCDTVIDGCECGQDSSFCGLCDAYYTAKSGCPHHTALTQQPSWRPAPRIMFEIVTNQKRVTLPESQLTYRVEDDSQTRPAKDVQKDEVVFVSVPLRYCKGIRFESGLTGARLGRVRARRVA